MINSKMKKDKTEAEDKLLRAETTNQKDTETEALIIQQREQIQILS